MHYFFVVANRIKKLVLIISFSLPIAMERNVIIFNNRIYSNTNHCNINIVDLLIISLTTWPRGNFKAHYFPLHENNTFKLLNIFTIEIKDSRLKIAHPRKGVLKVFERGLKMVEYCKTCKVISLIQKLMLRRRSPNSFKIPRPTIKQGDKKIAKTNKKSIDQ